MTWGWGIFITGAVLATVALIVTQSTTMIAAVAAVIFLTVVVYRLDGWQRLYGATLAALVAASSISETLAATVFYPRFAMIALLALWTWVAPGPRRRLSEAPPLAGKLVAALWVCTLIAGCTVVWSVNRMETATQVAALASLAWLVHGLITRRWHTTDDALRDLRIAFWVIGATLLASLALYAIGYDDAYTFGGRFKGIYNNPNRLALLAALTAPLGISLYVRYRRWTYLAGAAVAGLVILLAETRTALIALALAATWVLLRAGIKAILATVLTVAGVLSAWALGASIFGLPGLPNLDLGVLDRLTSLEGGDILNARTVGWSEAFTQWQQDPIGGVGYGAAPGLFADLSANGLLRFDSTSVHNSYLQWFLETGLIGLLPLMALLVVTASACVRVPRDKPELLPLAGGVVVGLIAQLAESAMFGTGQPYPFLFWPFVAALAIAAPSKTVRPQRSQLAWDPAAL